MEIPTKKDQVEALRQFGYTPSEAAFVRDAALHSGYFVGRQYRPHRGKAADNLVRRIVSLEHGRASKYSYKTRVYHLSAKPLYEALGQTDNRHRRARDMFSVRIKLMTLDYVLAHPQYRFLPTEQEKVQYFCEELGLDISVLPTRIYTGDVGKNTARNFVDKYPIRIDPETKRVGFCYIDDGCSTAPAFETWLAQYSQLIHKLGSVDIVCVALSDVHFKMHYRSLLRAFPNLGDLPVGLVAYFELKRSIEQRSGGLEQAQLDRFRQQSLEYRGVAFDQVYQKWLAGGGWREATGGPQIDFSTYVLPHSYRLFGSMLAAANA